MNMACSFPPQDKSIRQVIVIGGASRRKFNPSQPWREGKEEVGRGLSIWLPQAGGGPWLSARYDIASSSSSLRWPGTIATGMGKSPAFLAMLDTSGPGPSLLVAPAREIERPVAFRRIVNDDHEFRRMSRLVAAALLAHRLPRPPPDDML